MHINVYIVVRVLLLAIHCLVIHSLALNFLGYWLHCWSNWSNWMLHRHHTDLILQRGWCEDVFFYFTLFLTISLSSSKLATQSKFISPSNTLLILLKPFKISHTLLACSLVLSHLPLWGGYFLQNPVLTALCCCRKDSACLFQTVGKV